MPTRYIKESARTSKNLSAVSDFSERLFWRLVTTADDFGRFLACAAIVKSACFPLSETMKSSRVEHALQEIASNELIQLYEVGDRRYGWFITWEKQQGEPRAKSSKYPDPPPQFLQSSADICPQPSAYVAGASDTDTDTKTDLNPSSPNPKTKILSKDDAEFQDVWSAYPRKVGKRVARKAWDKLRTERPAVSVILEAIAAQRCWPTWTKDDGDYIPHLTTWLNQHRWEDEPMPPPQKPPRKPTSLVELL